MKSRSLFQAVLILLFWSSIGLTRDHTSSRSSGYRTYRGAKAIDADTFRYKGQRYRLRDDNALEKGQPGSGKATKDLQRRLDSGQYQYKGVARDQSFPRIVG